MHFPQLPDTMGMDVNFTNPSILADDWECSQTGPVENIHFWFSARGDWFDPYEDLVRQIANIHVAIYSNIPDPDGPGPAFSHPGDSLWAGDFAADSSVVSFNYYSGGDPDWWEPNTGNYVMNDHTVTYQCNLEGIPEPFIQEVDSIYWLALSITPGATITGDSLLGWKVADQSSYPVPYTGNHYEDKAVYGLQPMPTWREMDYPEGPPKGVDLSFVIGADTTITAVEETSSDVPKTYDLAQNYPNPFNPTTTIRYQLPERTHVRLAIYNVMGQRVRVLVDEPKPIGRYKVMWDGRNDAGEVVASGVYFYRMQAGTFTTTRKLVFLKSPASLLVINEPSCWLVADNRVFYW
jgi:hypothetical protein